MPGKEAPLNGNRVLNGSLMKADGIQSSAFCALCGGYIQFNQRWEIKNIHRRLDRERVHD